MNGSRSYRTVVLTQSSLADLEEYDKEHLVRKDVAGGAQYKCVLLHLLPGQEIPTHGHAGHEVILLPQKGQATLKVNGTGQVSLRPGCVYTAGDGSTFQITNDGAEPFQLLVTLVRLAGANENK